MSTNAETMLRNLLARIHRDGGHYVEAHGIDKALADADAKVVQWLAGASKRGAAVKNTTETIAWECPSCGHRHLWRWPAGKASPGGIIMHCDACGSDTDTEMAQIGERAWVALWPGE
jgi:predicted RNA-binding Zn-ribbon protein involved in translation (DUF1610 family)